MESIISGGKVNRPQNVSKQSDNLDAPTNSGVKVGHLAGQFFFNICAVHASMTHAHSRVMGLPLRSAETVPVKTTGRSRS
jgi:hypothetical protein